MKHKPPVWADRFFAWFCAPHLLHDLQGDLHERFYERIRDNGVRAARFHFVLDVFSFFRPYILRRRKRGFSQTPFRMLFGHYLKSAFRSMKRDKQFLVVNTLGLALGIGCSLLLVAYVYTELSYDRYVDDPSSVYRVSCSTVIDTKETQFAPIPPAIGLALKEALPEINNMARFMTWSYTTGNSSVSYQDKSFYQQNIFIADSTIFKVITFRFLAGNAAALRQPDRVVLSHTLAAKIFGPDYLQRHDLLQTVIRIDKQEFAVGGVVDDMPNSSHWRPEAMVGWQGRGNDNVWDDSHAYTYIRVNAGTDPQALQKRMSDFIAANENIKKVAEAFGAKVSVFIQPLTDIHLHSDKMYELSPGGSVGYIYAFAVLAVFFLFSSGINYTNLSIAASAHRFKEIGVRKVIGALRHQIQKQFMIEAVLITFIAAAIGAGLFYLLIPRFNALMEYKLDMSIFRQSEFLATATGVVVILSLLSGFYPAFYLSWINPIQILKSKFSGGPGKAHFRKTLLMTQFAISAIMIVAVLVVSAQMRYLSQKDLGFNKENVMIITIPDAYMKDLLVLKEKLLAVTGVSGAAVCDYVPGYSDMVDEHYVERANGEMKSSTVSRLHFDKDYLRVLGLEVIQGRNFDPTNEADYKAAYLVNEAAVKAYGWDKTPQGALGRKIEGFNYGKKGQVIGVVKDVNLFSLKQKVAPLVMGLTPYASFLYVKTDGQHPKEMVSRIEQTYKAVMSNEPLTYQFLDERLMRLYESDQKMNAALVSGSQVLIFISCLGLFGLSAFMVTQRTKEIGVRKVLGASLREITVLLTRDYVRLILLANVVAIPLGYLLMRQWLKSYAYRVDLSWWMALVPVCLTVLLALLSISFQVARASRANPVRTLRYE
jgi:putative ABC transport system permease protein